MRDAILIATLFLTSAILLVILGVCEHPEWWMGLPMIAIQLFAAVALWRNP